MAAFSLDAALMGLAGGALIGLAAGLMLLGVGRIAGISGLAARAAGLSESTLPKTSALAFVIGLPIGALVVMFTQGELPASFASPLTLAGAGLIVGLGTRLGSGCTSGHGVCGISRLAPRSIMATLTFMASGIATVATMNALGLEVLP